MNHVDHPPASRVADVPRHGRCPVCKEYRDGFARCLCQREEAVLYDECPSCHEMGTVRYDVARGKGWLCSCGYTSSDHIRVILEERWAG